MVGNRHIPYGPASPHWKGGRIINDQGYVLVLCHGHPRGGRDGYVREHILIAEKALGRYLPKSVKVHHWNEMRSDNANTNLVICEDESYHQLIHSRLRIFKGGGDPDVHKICGGCRSLKLRTEFHRNQKLYDGLTQNCKRCNIARSALAKPNKRAGLVNDTKEQLNP